MEDVKLTPLQHVLLVALDKDPTARQNQYELMLHARLTCIDTQNVSGGDVDRALTGLLRKRLVGITVTGPEEWCITAWGHEVLLVRKYQLAPETPIEATACNAAEPSVAFLCFSETELDEWWNGLDVECKADAFAGFSIRAQGQGTSFVAVDDAFTLRRIGTGIPVEGTIGNAAAQ